MPLEEVKYGVHASPVMEAQGVQDGDRILAVGGVTPKTLEEVTRAILIDEARELTILRNGEQLKLTLSPAVHDSILASGEKVLFSPRVPFVVDTVMAGGPAAAAGMQKGDRILAVDNANAQYYTDLREALGERKGKKVSMKVQRDSARIQLWMTVSEDGTVGIGNQPPSAFFKLEHESFGFFSAVPAGISYGLETLSGYVRSLKLLFSSTGAGQIGGFGAIGGLFSPTWDWQVFWNMTAFLSIILAFMNILPIPALDGGHVVFLLYEMVTGRPPNQRVLEVAQMVGMVLLLGLILFANGNDLFKALTGR